MNSPLIYHREGDYFTKPLSFQAIENSLFSYTGINTVLYSLDLGKTWEKYSSPVRVNEGGIVSWKCENPEINNITPFGRFSSSGGYVIFGNIMSLIKGDNYRNDISLSGKNIFKGLFENNKYLLSAENLILPSLELTKNCYSRMFYHCDLMRSTPELPGNILAEGCYKEMFAYCENLRHAPKEIVSEVFPKECCHSMFLGCKHLVIPCEISYKKIEDYACCLMYSETRLLKTPKLPEVENLSKGCYKGMFKNTTNLREVSFILKNKILTEECYMEMFYGCSNIKRLEMFAQDYSATDSLKNWIYFERPGKTQRTIILLDVVEPEDPALGLMGNWENIDFKIFTYPKEFYKSHLCFEAIEGGQFLLSNSSNDLEYSLDSGKTWEVLKNGSATPMIKKGKQILWRAENLEISDDHGIGTFISTGKFNVKGNIMSLIHGDNFIRKTDLSEFPRVFKTMFSSSYVVSAENLILPAKTLSMGCYERMFYNCDRLMNKPQYPSLSEESSKDMFLGCKKLNKK